MQALILAAGRGSRLGERNGGTAKCLLEIDRRPLVDHQIEALSGAGAGPIGMVVGYAADEIQEVVGIRAEYIRNPRFGATNSLYSFWLARDWVHGDVVVLNSDVLFAPQILERLLDAPGDAIAFDSGSGERREEMAVQVVEGRLADMSKSLEPASVSGENVGILKLTADTARLLFEKAGERIASGGDREWLGSAVREVARLRPIRAVDVRGLPWAEIDFPADLVRARREVSPAIRRATRRASAPFRIARRVALVLALLVLGGSSYRAWVAPKETVWESVAPEGARSVAVTDGERERPWWLLQEGETATLAISGPTTLRIDARPVFADGSAEEAHFVLRVSVDGKERGWHSVTSEPSGTWKLGEQRVGRRFRLTVDVPAGARTVSTRLSASDMDGCLLRFVQLDTEP